MGTRFTVRSFAIWLVMILVSWYGMMAIHECGHVAAAWLSGGGVKLVHIPLIGFSRTDVQPNPHPLPVALAGPLFGASAPLLLLPISRRWKQFDRFLRFFCGFCLVANGAYLVGGAITPVGDVVDLIRLGFHPVAIVLIGAPMIVAGFVLWQSVTSTTPRCPHRRFLASLTSLPGTSGVTPCFPSDGPRVPMDPKVHERLLAADVKGELEFPTSFDWERMRARVEAAKLAIEAMLGCSLSYQGSVQDASYFESLETRVAANARLGIRFSNFGDFVTVFTDTTDRTLLNLPVAQIEALLREHGFVPLPIEMLDTPYDGVNGAVWGPHRYTWWDRYFDYQ